MNTYRTMSEQLRHATDMYIAARATLVFANKRLIPRKGAMAEFNRARAKLQQAIKHANAFLYGNQEVRS